MKIVFITNFINHHQVHWADEVFKMIGDDFCFIETMPIPDWLLKSGYPTFERSYLCKSYINDKQAELAMQLAYESEVVIIGSAPETFVRKRIQVGKLTFRYSERWFKLRPWYLSGPRAWISYYMDHIRYKNKPLYMLAASAYTANDVYAIGAYKNKVFKWGYFPKVEFDNKKVEAPYLGASTLESTPLMWCARFLKLKHPELPVQLAKKLKEDGYKFTIDMFGSGVELEKTRELIKDLQVEDVVHLCGNLPNDQILQQMRNHEIFLFTSDKNEGWGAVLNEAMSNGCAVVSSNRIGATPFLIEDGKNGLIFESENIESLYMQVRKLLDDRNYANQLSKQAIYTMQHVWSPKNAARQLLNLIDALQKQDESLIPVSGPCSRTYPI